MITNSKNTANNAIAIINTLIPHTQAISKMINSPGHNITATILNGIFFRSKNISNSSNKDRPIKTYTTTKTNSINILKNIFSIY